MRDKAEGKLKETEGKLTDDEMREKQGQTQEKWGEAKDKAERREGQGHLELRSGFGPHGRPQTADFPVLREAPGIGFDLARVVLAVEAHVVRISIAPVKSLGLVHPESVDLLSDGVQGDRRFWLVDADGRLFNNKRNGPMMTIRPAWDEATHQLSLSFPDGTQVAGPVELGEPVAVELYGRPHSSRRVVGPWEEAISRSVGRPLTLLWSRITRRIAVMTEAPSRWSRAARSSACARRPVWRLRSTVDASG